MARRDVPKRTGAAASVVQGWQYRAVAIVGPLAHSQSCVRPISRRGIGLSTSESPDQRSPGSVGRMTVTHHQWPTFGPKEPSVTACPAAAHVPPPFGGCDGVSTDMRMGRPCEGAGGGGV